MYIYKKFFCIFHLSSDICPNMFFPIGDFLYLGCLLVFFCKTTMEGSVGILSFYKRLFHVPSMLAP